MKRWRRVWPSRCKVRGSEISSQVIHLRCIPRYARATIAAGLAISVGACFPAVTHGPRIDNGPALGISGSLTGGPTYTEGDDGGVRVRTGMIGAHVSHGWAPKTPKHPGLFAGLTVPVLYPMTQGELFMQLPPAWTKRFSAGAGVIASYEIVDVVGQFGEIDDTGNGWFVTQGVGRRRISQFYSNSIVSLSGVAYQFTRGNGRGYLYAQYAVGRKNQYCYFAPSKTCPAGERKHALAVGLSVEVRRRLAAQKK